MECLLVWMVKVNYLIMRLLGSLKRISIFVIGEYYLMIGGCLSYNLNVFVVVFFNSVLMIMVVVFEYVLIRLF